MEDLVPYRRSLANFLFRQKPFPTTFAAVAIASKLHFVIQVDTTSDRYVQGQCHKGDHISTWNGIPFTARLKSHIFVQ